MSAAALLSALDDELLRRARIHTAEALQHLRKLGEYRNQSVLAHGYQSIAAEQSRQIEGMALQLLRAFWALHQPDENIDQLSAMLRFVRQDN
jgi:hypothetical protein